MEKAYTMAEEHIPGFIRTSEHSIDVQLRTSEHRSMYSYVRLSIESMYT